MAHSKNTSSKRRNKQQWPLRIASVLLVFAAGVGVGTAAWQLHKPVATVAVVTGQQPKNLSQDLPSTVTTPTETDVDYTLPPAKDGLAPVVTHLDTKQPVVFLGIDDGAYKDPSVVQIMKDNHIKASLFLAKVFISNNPDFFKQLVDEGSVIEDHTLDHDTQMIKKETYAQQKAEICGMADYEQQHYGKRPLLFRPPGGAYSDTMRKAAYDCGMKAVVTWIAKANGGAMQYQIGHTLRAGDIVLMHFRPEFKQDMAAFVAAENAAGLHTELLEDAIKS